MKKSSFVAMVMGTVSGILFSLGMCMALLPEWNAFKEGVIFGSVGLVLGLNLIGGKRIDMAKSKLVKAGSKVADITVKGYKTVEKGVVM